jgi:tetratricopeptide (TPR) repeat protein
VVNAEPAGASDYDSELARLEADLAAAGPAPGDAAAATELAGRHYARAALTATPEAFTSATATIGALAERFDGWPDLAVLEAMLHVRLHRLGAARGALGRVPGVSESPRGRALRADVALQDGLFDEARALLEPLVADGCEWDDLARLAHLEATLGRDDAADALYARAEDELTAKQLRSYAWVELQRARLDLSSARFDEAEAHCGRAAAAYSGWWLVDEQLGRLRVAEGRPAEALEAYERAHARTSRPELEQAIGDVCTSLGRHDQAARSYDSARGAYLESAGRREPQYLHHLAELAATRGDGDEAVRWARRDRELRGGPATIAALAWAFCIAGEPEQAAAHIDEALATGAFDAGLRARAGAIYRAAGREADADRLAARPAELALGH